MSGRDLLTDERLAGAEGGDPQARWEVSGYALREEPCTDPYARFCGQTGAAAPSDPMCDRHASRLAGANPAMALGRREHVGEGKGARRNSPCTLWTRKLARALPEGSQ